MAEPDLTPEQRQLLEEHLVLQRSKQNRSPDMFHYKMLQQGVKAWNEWRNNNPHINPDLKGAHLTEAYLEGVNFNKTNLRGARLEGANLKGSDLRDADLRGAVLAAEMPSTLVANLTNSDLRGAKFTSEDISFGAGSFLDLSACGGLETVKFSEITFLNEYLVKAFEYAHRNDIPETIRWPNFVQYAIHNIKLLQLLYENKKPSKDLEPIRITPEWPI